MGNFIQRNNMGQRPGCQYRPHLHYHTDHHYMVPRTSDLRRERHGGQHPLQVGMTAPAICNICIPTITSSIEPICNVTFAGINKTTSGTVGGTLRWKTSPTW